MAKHGHTKNGKSPTYYSWSKMKERCYNKNHKSYEFYGGKGVKVCDAWRNSFEVFLKDMGERPLNKTLDRIDPFGHYEPSNCRWASPKLQWTNKRKDAA